MQTIMILEKVKANQLIPLFGGGGKKKKSHDKSQLEFRKNKSAKDAIAMIIKI
jgi:hypothetical protein